MKKLLIWVLLSFTFFARSQNKSLIINDNIRLPKDSLERLILVKSINGFLEDSQKPNEENRFVLLTEKIETDILLDEFKGIQKSGRFKDDYFYKPYLTNLVSLPQSQYLIKLAYIGINEKTPITVANFEIIAHKTDEGFVFSSPLIRNTQNWKVAKVGNCIFHYETAINKTKINEYEKMASVLDKKLKSVNKITEFYSCEDFSALQKLIGVDYKLEYNGQSENTFSSVLGDKKLIVTGNHNANFDSFDPHDLWHDRLSLVVSRRKVYKPVDEAIAFVYGGSWGMTWQEIFNIFKTKVANDKNADWVGYKEKPFNFGESQEKDLMVDHIVNALIVKKLEKEKGFAAVWELLNCGKYEKGNENYYKSLEKLTGITKSNYNEKVWELIDNEKI
ncbi:MAG: hypothetical protein U5N85_01575 [Arcicella sp.]|nr:hypothetical protein [Arcicella sp.]